MNTPTFNPFSYSSCVETTVLLLSRHKTSLSPHGSVFHPGDMLLYPSSRPPWNTTFRNAEGQIIYKTELLMRYGLPRQITIKRILPPNSIDLATGSEDALRDSFSDLAEIHYEILSSRIRYNGTETATNHFFRKSGFIGR